MKKFATPTSIIFLTATAVSGFVPHMHSQLHMNMALQSSVGETPFFLDEVAPSIPDEVTTESKVEIETQTMKAEAVPKARKPVKKAAGKGKHTEGIFSPLVYALKDAMGKEKFMKVRGKVISLHSGVIKDFVDTYDSEFGTNVLVKLFAIVDKDGNGTIDKEELALAFETLGFTWLEEKQTDKIFKRADTDKNGEIDFEEFAKETPKTLKTNLVKLAKKNGDEMGFLV